MALFFWPDTSMVSYDPIEHDFYDYEAQTNPSNRSSNTALSCQAGRNHAVPIKGDHCVICGEPQPWKVQLAWKQPSHNLNQ